MLPRSLRAKYDKASSRLTFLRLSTMDSVLHDKIQSDESDEHVSRLVYCKNSVPFSSLTACCIGYTVNAENLWPRSCDRVVLCRRSSNVCKCTSTVDFISRTEQVGKISLRCTYAPSFCCLVVTSRHDWAVIAASLVLSINSYLPSMIFCASFTSFVGSTSSLFYRVHFLV